VKQINGAILVLTYNRADHLDKLLSSIENAATSKNLPLVLVRQIGDDEVKRIVEKWRSRINLLIETDGSGDTVPINIGRNRLIGYSSVFDSLDLDWVLVAEDDVVLAPDAIVFSKFIIEKYSSQSRFRGINLGSRLKQSEIASRTYCLTRYGIFGQASVLTRQSWNRMRRLRVLQYANEGHWDSAMEAYMKTGLTIAPNNSRYLDHGWSGSHMTANSKDPYFLDLKNSFAEKLDNFDGIYTRAEIGYWWREDLRKFNRLESLIYWLRFLILHPMVIRAYKSVKPVKSKLDF
jgi:glycosyltransferase involved in cell wall biosynthesis